MANLRTDFKDDILNAEINARRKYQMITNEDGTVSFEDVTEYSQEGDLFGALAVNAMAEAINQANDVASTAQSTANTAKTNAATAQSTANTAKTNASTAQTTANNAYNLAAGKSNALTTGYYTANWSIGSYGYSAAVEFNIAKSGYTAIGIIGFDSGATGVVAVGCCDLSSGTVARIRITNVNEINYAHSGTASIRVLYVKN